MKLLDLCLLIDIFITVKSWPCLSPIRKAYSRVNSSATLEFTADLKDLETLGRQFEVRFYDGTPKARITFYTDKDPKLEAAPGVSITGDSAGNVVVTLANVQESNAGIYITTSTGFATKCSCLYILGIPRKPNIILKQIPFVGENTTFTCDSTSTTMPSNHSLSLTYTWIVNGVNMPKSERYSYALNKTTITNVVMGDVDRQFRCSAREDYSLGYSSEKSEIFLFKVNYGPDIAMISVDSPYHITEGEASKKITCTSTCNPECTYKWTHLPSGLSADVLSFNPINRSVAGDYKCTIRNTAAPNTKYVSKNVKIIVYYPPTVTVRTSVTDIKEGHEMTLFCEGDGVPPDNTYISLTQTFNKVNIPNTNSALNGTYRFSSIHFSSLSFQDTGTYTCILKNGIKNKNGEIEQSGSKDIFVEALPKILTDDLRFTGSTEGVGRIKISIYSYPALSQVTLLRHDQNVLSSDRNYVSEGIVRTSFYGKDVSLNGSIFKYDIHDLKKKDFGNYTLNVQNSIGTTKAIVSLNAEEPPGTPRGFTIDYIQYNKARLSWMRGYNGGLPQTFVIQLGTGERSWEDTEVQDKVEQNDKPISKILTGLSDSTKYYVRLYAYNKVGNSPLSEILIFTTSPIKVETETTTTLVVGIGLSVVIIVVISYAIYVTIRLKRNISFQKNGHAQKKDGRVNIHIEDSTNIPDSGGSDNPYTDLQTEMRDSGSPYEAISTM